MKLALAGSALLALVFAGSTIISEPALAKGCIKGAIVGGVAGHMVGHGKVGIVAGCVIGHHQAVEQERQRHHQMQQNTTHAQ
jgi:uncharacterized protein YcfJ